MTRDDSTAGLAFLCDATGNLVSVIRDDVGAADRIVGGQQFVLLLDRGSTTKALSFLAELRAKGATFDWEMNVPTKDGVITLHFAGSKIEGAAGNMLIVGARTHNGILQLFEELMRINNEQVNALRESVKQRTEDSEQHIERDNSLYDQISCLNNELVTMQRELAKKNIELERLNEQKNQFLGMAAHDLRNPLAAIMAYSEFLAQDLNNVLNDEQREFVTTIQSSSEFMLKLVSDLLDIAKIESGKLQLSVQLTDLAALARRIVARANVLSSKKQIAVRLVAEELPLVQVDPTKIEQVLTNLIINAVKFSHPGTTVTMRLARQGDDILLSVADQGQGIPAGELDTLFRPFQRTSVRSTAGEKDTGLGLAIVRKIVQGHAGRIWVESEVGQGTTFFVALPINGAPV